MDIPFTFSNFLQEKAILTQRQAAKLGSTIDTHGENQSIFKLADFFRSLTPSDCYDLSLRLFLLWGKEAEKPKTSPKNQKSLQRFFDILAKSLQKSQRSAFNLLRASVSSPRPHQLSVHTSKHRSISPVESQLKSPNSFNSSDVFEFLHNEAQRKNYIRFQNEQRRLELESQACTFQPNLSKSSGSFSKNPVEVFDRLQQDLRKEKQEINQAKKFHMEMKDCTFTPQTTKSLSTRSKGSNFGEQASSLDTSTLDRTFDRLYKQHHTKRQASIENEFKKRALETKDCTFTPSLTARASQGPADDPDRYNKLYKMHAERQRNLMKKRIDKSIEEESKYSFKPSLISPAKSATSRGTSKDVRERLQEWNNEKKRRLESKMKEKVDTETNMHNELNLPAKKMNENYAGEERGSVSTFQRLYQDNQHKKQRKEVLEQRILREIGASFTPKTNHGRNSSAKKEQSERWRSLYNGSPDGNSNCNQSREGIRIFF